LRQLYYPTFLLWQVQRSRHPASTLVGQIVKATAIEVVKDIAEVVVKVCVIPHAKVGVEIHAQGAKESAVVVQDVQGHAKAPVNSDVEVEININD